MLVSKTALAAALLIAGLSSAHQLNDLYARDDYLASLTRREVFQAREASLDRLEAREAYVERLGRRDYADLDDGLYRRETKKERAERLEKEDKARNRKASEAAASKKAALDKSSDDVDNSPYGRATEADRAWLKNADPYSRRDRGRK